MIRKLFQLILLPLFIPLRLLYADMLRQPSNVLYAWYRSKKDFDAINESSQPEEDEYRLKTWHEWQEGAEEECAKWKALGTPFIKVIVRPQPLLRWLRENQLANTSGNRELYIKHVFDKACDEGFEPARKKA